MKQIVSNLKNELFKIQSRIEVLESAKESCIKNLSDPMRTDKQSIASTAVRYMNELGKLNEKARLIKNAIENLKTAMEING